MNLTQNQLFEQYLEKIKSATRAIEFLHEKYKDKKKGEIFSKSLLHQKQIIGDYLNRVDNISRGLLTTWDITIESEKNPAGRWIDITIDSSIKEENIIARLALSGMKVTYIKPQKNKIQTGFPRIIVK